MVSQILHHTGQIQLFVVNILLLRPDLHGNAGKMRGIQGQNIGRRVGYNFIIHNDTPFFLLRIGFLITCSIVSIFLYLVKKIFRQVFHIDNPAFFQYNASGDDYET